MACEDSGLTVGLKPGELKLTAKSELVRAMIAAKWCAADPITLQKIDTDSDRSEYGKN
jgi:hypothetical protein